MYIQIWHFRAGTSLRKLPLVLECSDFPVSSSVFWESGRVKCSDVHRLWAKDWPVCVRQDSKRVFVCKQGEDSTQRPARWWMTTSDNDTVFLFIGPVAGLISKSSLTSNRTTSETHTWGTRLCNKPRLYQFKVTRLHNLTLPNNKVTTLHKATLSGTHSPAPLRTGYMQWPASNVFLLSTWDKLVQTQIWHKKRGSSQTRERTFQSSLLEACPL